MLRILPHFFFFKEGAPFVVIPAYCTTNPHPKRIRHIRNEPHCVRLHLLHCPARRIRLPQHRAVRVVANRRCASFQQKLLPRHP